MQALNDLASRWLVLASDVAQLCFPSYPEDKLEVVGFWSSEFADTETSSAADFRKQLKAKLPEGFKLKFIISDNVKTNGPRQHACYRWLKDQCNSDDIPGDYTKF